ncbi:hypothetical protein FGO68_gene3749 [Halteria grandinella]|uniref:Uncharacterized protein n=1 Tax=Halteria grandinella TaxID=5974 RepID=A0A8J8NXG9_HALGN|nr:hypothetical protein FGO68_gene3749 [Halteria grandinella]
MTRTQVAECQLKIQQYKENIFIQLMMKKKQDQSLVAFLRDQCHLEGQQLSKCADFFHKMGLKTIDQLLAFIPNQTVKDLVQLGLPESLAIDIVGHGNKILTKRQKTKGPILPRVTSKYLTFIIMGYAYPLHEAIDLVLLCKRARLLILQNYKIFIKQCIDNREKVKIKSLFQLLDERLHSKSYKICFQGSPSGRDLADCCQLFNSKVRFYSFECRWSLSSQLNQFLPIKITIQNCNDIPQLFEILPLSVTKLHLFQYQGKTPKIKLTPRKFKKLQLSGNQNQTLYILNHFAIATEKLKLDSSCLKSSGIANRLAKMDCKEIIIVINEDLEEQQFKQLLARKPKAKIYLHFSDGFKSSSIHQQKWAFDHMQCKYFDKPQQMSIKNNCGTEQLCNTLFMGPYARFKRKIVSVANLHNENVQFSKSDTETEELDVEGYRAPQIATIALNICKNLKVLKISSFYDLPIKELTVNTIGIEELEIYVSCDASWVTQMVNQILLKNKDTLKSIKCSHAFDFSNLKNSKCIRKLDISKCSDDSLNIIDSLQNLQELSTKNNRIVQRFKQSKTLEKFEFKDCLRKSSIKVLPESIKIVTLNGSNEFNSVKEFLDNNPQVKEITLTIDLMHQIAYLLHDYKHIKFNFLGDTNLFTMHQLYAYLHPLYIKPQPQPAEEPDKRVYELLFQRLTDKQQLFQPYVEAVISKYEMSVHDQLVDCPKRLLDQLAYFEEFEACICNAPTNVKKFDASHFEQAFKNQLDYLDEENLLILMSTYDEVFQLGSNAEHMLAVLKGMNKTQRKKMTKQSFFQMCRRN